MQLHEEFGPAPVAGGHGKNGAIAMGSLLADMNHDIRTSMNGVRGMLELLLDTGLTPSQREYARTAQHNVDHLLESLERIVDMSLIESNKLRFNRAPFDLRTEVESALEGKPASASAKGIELSIVYPPSVRLFGDASRLRETLSALADVALQCTAGGEMTIRLDATCMPGSRCRVMLESRVARLSEDGARLATMMNEAPPSAEGKGMLGIAVCTHLVQLMNGSVAVDRTAAPGALFRLSLDLPIAGDALSAVHTLILSEQAGYWSSMMEPLACLGMRVDACDTASAGLAAIETAARNASPYHLILLGRLVQGMDADVLAGAIRSNPAFRNARLVLLYERESDQRVVDGGMFAARFHPSTSAREVESTLSALGSAAANTASQSGRAAAAQQKDDDRSASFAGYTILVADDNPVNQQVAARMLEKLGCKTAIAADGMQAIEMHTWKRFDLILMDCDMPVLDGLEATQRIRAAEGTAHRTPIIALTACTGQGEQERCVAAGMDDFLSKPIRPQMLGDMLARWLPRQSPAADMEAEAATVPACTDELEDIREMFGADFAELASLYQNDGPPRLTAIREAAAAGDCAKVAKIAHAFAGSSASIGATGLSALSKTVEMSAKAGSLEDFDKRIAAIDAEYFRICGKLRSLLTP